LVSDCHYLYIYTHLIKASDSCDEHAVAEFEHVVADLLQQRRILRFGIILRR
jgi:hypothetical protein